MLEKNMKLLKKVVLHNLFIISASIPLFYLIYACYIFYFISYISCTVFSWLCKFNLYVL